MDDQTKCEIYTKLLNSLNKNGELKEEIDRNTYSNQVKLIKTDLLSKENSDQETALQMLKILIENNVQDIQQDVLTILSDENIDQDLKTTILDSIRNYIKELLQSNNVINLASLYSHWKNFDLQKFTELLENATLQETQEDSQLEPVNFVNLIIEHFIPMMSSSSQSNLKQPLIEVATKIAEMYPVARLSAEELQEVLKKVPGLLTNLVNLQKSNEVVWREPLHFLTKYLDETVYSPEVREMFSNSSLNWDLVQIDLESNIYIELVKYISENNLVLIGILFRGWKNLGPQKFTTALKEICQNSEYTKYCKIFFFDKLIPVIMAIKDMCDPMKVYYIEIALEFASSLPLMKLSTEEYNKFSGSVTDYIKNISDLRDMNFEHWHKLWIFLVRLFGKKLHHSMTLINRLLRVVEHAFRNSSFEQRLRGYDCWKELIDNSSLDSHHICSEKQIRLLLTPLRAKFSKQEAVIVKRFEVFVYLIEKLQDKALLVLKEFLEFCFGEVGEGTDPNKSGQGKSLPELWVRSAKVLMAMLGHSHNSNVHCLETNTEICLRRPVLNSNNISNHYYHTINSIAESCILLKEVELNQRRNTVLKCFWASLLGIVLDDNVAQKDKCINTLGKALERFLKDNDPYRNSIAAEILKSTIKFDWSKVSLLVLNNLEHFNRIIFSVSLNKESYVDIEKFQTMLCTDESEEVTLKIIHNLFNCFTEYQTIESNANFVAQFWIFLANELDDSAKNKCLNFLVWPALHIHQVTDSAKEVLIYEHYKQIVTKFVEKSDEVQLGLFKNFEKVLKNNPLLLKNVFTLVTMFTPKTENKEIANVTLDILDLMMLVPATKDNSQRQNLVLFVKKFYESNVTDIHDHGTIKKLCNCLQHILKFKHYDIVTVVEASLKALPDNVKWVHGKFLSLDFLMDLFEKETDVSAAEKIHKLIDVFRNVKNPEAKKDVTSFIPLGGRSAKIAKLVKQIPASPNKRSDSPTTLRLFGKNIDTQSPFNVKGSQLKDLKDTPTKTKESTPTRKSKKAARIDDESNSKFVLIESEVKLDKSKLTEHQKEALKKRREDIPALYQDLSQSMTQSLESRSVSAKMEDNIVSEDNCSKEIEQSLHVQQEEEKCTEGSDKTQTENNTKSLNKSSEPISEINQSSSLHVNNVTADKSKNDSLETESQDEELSKEELKKAAVEAELKKLSMSIVGAEEFFAANSKRKRREKKRNPEENKEKSSSERKSKGPQAMTSKVKHVAEEKNENPVVENNELEKVDVQMKKLRSNLKKKEISDNQRPESPTKGITHQVPSTKSEADKSTGSIPNAKEVEVVKKRKVTGNTKRNSLAAKKAGSETPLKGERDSEGKISVEFTKLPIEDSSGDGGNKTDNKLGNFTTKAEIDTKEVEVVKKKERKSVPAKKEPSEAFQGRRDIQAKMTEEDIPAESQSTEEKINETVKLILNTEINRTAENIELDTSESVVINTKEAVKTIVPNTPKVPRKRGWPLGVKRSPSSKRNSVENSPACQSPVRKNIEARPKTPVKITNVTDAARMLVSKTVNTNSSLEDEKSPAEVKYGSDKVKQKRTNGRSGGKRKSLSKEDKPLEAEPTEIDVYKFDTEQERAIESEVVLLRSPNKDNKLTLATKSILNAPAISPAQKIQAKKNLLISDASNVGETPPTGRKSKRKSIPTEKFTQSELFKSAEPTTQAPRSSKSKKLSTPVPKVLNANKKLSKKNDVINEKSTQSEFFKQTDAENEDIQPLTGYVAVDKESASSFDIIKQTDTQVIKLGINETKSDIVDTEKSEAVTNNENLKSKENIFRKALKRKRSSSDDDEDIIESSQDSTISNVSAAKFKQSLTKKSSSERSLAAEIKQNIKEIKKTEEIIDYEPFDQAHVDISKKEITPEETKKKRGRPAKSPSKHNSLSAGTKVYEDSQLSIEIQKSIKNQIERESTPEVKKQRRGRPTKSPKSDKSVTEINISEYIITDIPERDKSTETPNDNDTTKILVTPEETNQTNKPQDEPGEQIQSDSDVTKINTSPEEKKGKRGRPRKNPAKSVELFETQTECQNSGNESLEESQSLAAISGKSSGLRKGTVVENSEETTKPFERKLKEDSETIQPTIFEFTENDKILSIAKRKRHQKNAEENELLEDVNDAITSADSTVHILEAIHKAALTFDEKAKRSRRTEKESEEPIGDVMQEVKKQVFPEMLQEPIDLNISTQKPEHRTQSQDTQTQGTESMDINDEIQLQLDLPQKPSLNESDKEIARMDTASLSLGNLEDLRGFEMSSNVETGIEITKTVTENRALTEDVAESEIVINSSEESEQSINEKTENERNKTTIENKTLTEDIAESETVINASEETRQDYKSISVIVNKAVLDTDKIIPKDETLRKDSPDSGNIVNSNDGAKQLTESSEITEIAESEVINSQVLVNMEVQQVVEIESTSPVIEQTAGKCIGTPGPLESSLPSSPVTGDTPNRTSELLNCTSDISPIGSKSGSHKSSSDDEFVEQRKLVPVALKFDEDVDHETNKEKSPEKADDAPEKIDMSPEKAEKNVGKATSSSPPKDEARTSRDVKNIAERSSRFFDMVRSGSPTTLRLFSKRKGGLNMSPSASRIKKLMSNVKAPSQSETSDKISQEDILTFTREVPSPLAVPRSILKRKHSDTLDDGTSPCAKRKRVNFSDPCTTSKKVFMKEENDSSQCLFGANPDDDLDKQFLEVLAANNIIETPPTESDNIETEQSLQINNPMLLRDDVPIYPDLLECEESVGVISRKLTSAMFVNALLSKLNSKNIKTIGDLARQSEVSIARLPFKTPMVANVYKALDNYYHKKFKSKVNKEKHEARVNGEPETITEATVSLSRLEVALVKMDVKDELLKILERAQSQNMSAGTLCSLLFSTIDQKEVLTYVKSNFNLETKDIVDEKDYPKIVKHIIETVGLPKIFEILTESIESSEDESVYFDCMIKHSIENKPLSYLIEKRSLHELQAALWENVENQMYTKKQLLDTCFLPFVNPIDLSSIFSKLTRVEIEDVVITRLKTEDYPVFTKRILQKFSSHAKVKEELLNICTINELTSNIVKRGSPQEIMSSFTYMFLSTEKSKDDLVQIFRLVSDSVVGVLPPTKLMELSIEFQKKIPLKD